MYEELLVAQRAGDREAEGRLIVPVARESRERADYYMVGGPPIRRLLSKVAFGGSTCWYWTGSLDEVGYGRVGRVLGETRAHRLSFRIFNGDIPEGMRVLHRCDVRNCVNPEHLFLGTQRDNVRDMLGKGRHRTGDNSGEKNGQAKLTEAKVAAIRALVALGDSQRSVAARFGVSPMAISRAVRKETWR